MAGVKKTSTARKPRKKPSARGVDSLKKSDVSPDLFEDAKAFDITLREALFIEQFLVDFNGAQAYLGSSQKTDRKVR